MGRCKNSNYFAFGRLARGTIWILFRFCMCGLKRKKKEIKEKKKEKKEKEKERKKKKKERKKKETEEKEKKEKKKAS